MNKGYFSALRILLLGVFLILSGAAALPLQAQKRAEMLVSADWLAKNLKANDLTILHVAAQKSSYEKGHIEGARFLAWSELTATRGGFPNELPPVEDLQKLFTRLGLGNSGRIVVYGDQQGLMAARLFFTLDYLGHGSRVALLNGGLEKWQAEKRGVSTAEPVFAPADFTPRVDAKTVTFLQTVRDVSWLVSKGAAKDTLLLDARPPDEYSGAKPGDGIKRPGHIPGAVNLFWMDNLASRENPVMKSRAELQKLYQSKGFVPGKRVIAYCRTGGQASHAYFTLKYLGYDAVMYDGSFIEWSSAADTPVE
jgi:thiosulfate/3-mercaptopyruvate sulfurtransferase